jgi:hypothetical protein
MQKKRGCGLFMDDDLQQFLGSSHEIPELLFKGDGSRGLCPFDFCPWGPVFTNHQMGEIKAVYFPGVRNFKGRPVPGNGFVQGNIVQGNIVR